MMTAVSIGCDNPELVLRVWPAERVPGLWNGRLEQQGKPPESYWDLTLAQVHYIAWNRGARIEGQA